MTSWPQIPTSRTNEAGSNFQKRTPDFEKMEFVQIKMIRNVKNGVILSTNLKV